MFKRSHVAMTGAIALATLLVSLPLSAAQAPVRDAPHWVLNGNAPLYYTPLKGPDKGKIETVKLDLSANDTQGLLTLQDEVWGPKFDVPLHFHKRHAEVFYVMSGAVQWTIGGETHVVHAGELVYIPPNTPHKVHVVGNKPETDIFISMPGGYEFQNDAPKDFSQAQLGRPAAKALLGDLADFHKLPDDTDVPPDNVGPGPYHGAHHFALTGHIRTVHNPAGNVTSKIDVAGWQSEGRFTIQDEIWPADFKVGLHYHKLHSEIFYVMGGAVEWTVDGVTHVMHKGDLVYIPPHTAHKVHVVGGHPAHMLFIQLPGGYERSVDFRNEFTPAQLAKPVTRKIFQALEDHYPLPDPHPFSYSK